MVGTSHPDGRGLRKAALFPRRGGSGEVVRGIDARDDRFRIGARSPPSVESRREPYRYGYEMASEVNGDSGSQGQSSSIDEVKSSSPCALLPGVEQVVDSEVDSNVLYGSGELAVLLTDFSHHDPRETQGPG